MATSLVKKLRLDADKKAFVLNVFSWDMKLK
jgi:hypothetical protein